MASAEREGGFIFYNGTFWRTLGQAMATAFQARYPNLTVGVVRAMAQVVCPRLL